MVTGQRVRMFGRIYSPRLERAHTSLEDGQVLRVGGTEVQAIATPGHTPGSMSYLVDGCALFVGDALTVRGGWVAPPMGPISMDNARARASLKKLAALHGVEWLCTGHSGCISNWEQAISPWRV